MNLDMQTQPDTSPTEGPVSEMTVEEYLDTLTGFDEIAITRAFGGMDIYTATSSGQQGRALIFVDLRRKGMPDKPAYGAAQEMPLKGVRTYFTDPDVANAGEVVETADGFEQRSPLGEGVPAAGGMHSSAPSGVSRQDSPGVSGTS